MRVLGFGTYDGQRHPRIAIVLDGLRAHGDTVLEANVPLRLTTGQRIAMVGRPWLAYRLVLMLGASWWQLARRARIARREGRLDAIIVGYLGQFDVLLARLLFPKQTIVLDQLVFGAETADDRGLTRSSGLKHRLLSGLDALAVRAADLVLLDTLESCDLLGSGQRHKALVVPVGASASWFDAGSRPRRPSGDRPLRVVFFGLFTPLQGTRTIADAIAALRDRDDIEFTIIGTGQDVVAARAIAAGNPHVSWLDWVSPEQLPAEVADHDVCLGIMGTGPKALRVVPNKVYQGAAAGCAILTSDTAPQRRAMSENAVFVTPGDATALADRLIQLAGDRAAAALLGSAARERALASFPADAIVDPLRMRLGANNSGKAMHVQDRDEAHELPPLSPMATLRWDVVRRRLDALAPHAVLEVGCGQGGFGARLAARSTYLGVEPDEKSWEVACQRVEPRGGGVRLGTSDVLRADERFDVICAFEVIEHLEDDCGALQDWAGHLRPGGSILVSVPAWPDRFGPMDALVGHYRRYTPAHLADVLRAAGGTDVQVHLYGWPLGYALEAVRNRIAKRRGRATEDSMEDSMARDSMEQRSATSGRILQPSRLGGSVVRVGALPFTLLQRLRPQSGTGLVATARWPNS